MGSLIKDDHEDRKNGGLRGGRLPRNGSNSHPHWGGW